MFYVIFVNVNLVLNMNLLYFCPVFYDLTTYVLFPIYMDIFDHILSFATASFILFPYAFPPTLKNKNQTINNPIIENKTKNNTQNHTILWWPASPRLEIVLVGCYT